MKKWVLLSLAVALQCIAFSTLVTDGLIIHLDAGSITGLNDGDPVTTWADLATTDAVNGNVTAVSGWNAPIYQSGAFDGNAVVRMQGGDLLASSLLTLPNVNVGLTVFVVAQGDRSGESAERILQLGSKAGTGGKCFGVDFSTNTAGADGGSGARFNNGKSLVRVNNPLSTGFHIAAMQINQGETYGSLRYYVDDMTAEVFDNSASPGNLVALDASGNELTIGTGIATNGSYYTSDDYQGDIAEILIYNSQLSQAQMQQVLDYLAAKYTIWQAWNPAPADGAINQGVINGSSLDVTFDWNTGVDPDNTSVPNPDITKHYFYIREGDPNFVNVTPQEISAGSPVLSTAFAGPLALDYDATYYWRVDESINDSAASDPNTIRGPVWSFETLKSIPVIITNPTHTLVDLGQTAELTVSATSLSPLQYAWYKSVDNSAAVTPEDDILVGSQEVLTLVGVDAFDEGYYYCVLTNDSGEASAQRTTVAQLGVVREVAHWTFDAADLIGGVYRDSSGEGHDAEPNVVPAMLSFVDGVSPLKTADAVDFTVEPLTVADAGDWAPSAYTGQFTFSAWVKWAGPNGSWQGVLANRVTPAQANFYVEIRQDNGNIQIGSPHFGSGDLIGTNLPVGQWAHVAISAGYGGVIIYIDGLPVASRVPARDIPFDVLPVYVGSLGRTAAGALNNPFNGVFDDVRLFNTAFDRYEIADLYYGILEKPLCLNPDNVNLSFDVAGGGVDGDESDCIVNLTDFAKFAETWLNCGYYPQEGCN